MGNKNNCNNANFVQVGYQNSGCGCDNGCDAAASIPYHTDCDCDNDYAAATCGCDTGAACSCGGKRHHGHHDKCSECGSYADETHVFFDSCDGAKEICVTGRCQEEEAPGRMLDVSCTLQNVCPGRRSALGLTLTEVDKNGAEYARGFRAVTVPAHNNRCNQDVQVDAVRFILPEDLSLQDRRHFIVRTQHHYLDANSIWNNGWGGRH